MWLLLSFVFIQTRLRVGTEKQLLPCTLGGKGGEVVQHAKKHKGTSLSKAYLVFAALLLLLFLLILLTTQIVE
jgi:hypothetical protein